MKIPSIVAKNKNFFLQIVSHLGIRQIQNANSKARCLERRKKKHFRNFIETNKKTKKGGETNSSNYFDSFRDSIALNFKPHLY
jgi:hypothetical protein